ncbi:prephenate dehydrogenase [Paenibacillus sp. ACRRX]|uniref:prephenate dehydrogenase n=1 Tax=unclassified Paenibacillus TaxID=185978 RepID=UPI001EF5C95F|nr:MULTISPECIES: prephenate dehydrogenase [unclassified Paenibacillus]MCG7406465.1 prephenate dehydrogenase [Paenibacillus sp. ACRRX]MDK8179497.1 prephenate dehydrogenase [Paenibacillus sp. UMB4589-SE434]
MSTNIAILGVGLIGGSLALCFKGKPGIKVIGYSPNPSSTDKYVKRGVVDTATTSLEEAVSDADYIFVCSPVGMLDSMLLRLRALPLRRGCVVTDVGSTKASVSKCARELNWEDVHFIGGHPMAGSERSGVEAASTLLFENAFYVLTPDEEVNESAYQRLVDLLQYTRAHIIRMNPEEHDRVVGAISHLPHIVAAALVNQVREYNEQNDMYVHLAAGGFRDITRIASSDPTIWSDILINNRDVMLTLLRDWRHNVEDWIDILTNKDSDRIQQAFKQSGEFRSRMPERRKGIIHALYDLYMDVPDTPGIIGKIATVLGSHHINLSNLQIIESREDVPGVLRLSFRQQDDWDKANALLTSIGYTVYV